MANSQLSEKKWKYVSIGLIAVLALGFSFPQAFAAPIDSVLSIVKDIQAKVNDATFGLQAIMSAVSNTNTGLPAVNAQLDEIKTTLQQSSLPGTLHRTTPQILVPDGENGGFATSSIPEGKIFVVETISGWVDIPSGQVVDLDVSGYQIVPTLVGTSINAQIDRYAFHQPTRIYLGVNSEEFTVSFARDNFGSDGQAFVQFDLTGYLVDKPVNN